MEAATASAPFRGGSLPSGFAIGTDIVRAWDSMLQPWEASNGGEVLSLSHCRAGGLRWSDRQADEGRVFGGSA